MEKILIEEYYFGDTKFEIIIPDSYLKSKNPFTEAIKYIVDEIGENIRNIKTVYIKNKQLNIPFMKNLQYALSFVWVKVKIVR